MGYQADTVTILTLNAVSVTPGDGTPIDLGGYKSGVFVIVTTIFGTGWTPTFNSTPDGTNYAPLTTAEIGTVAAVSGNGVVRYPVLCPTNLGLVRVHYVIASTAVTAKVYFQGHL